MQKSQCNLWLLTLLLSIVLLSSCEDNTDHEHFNNNAEPAANIIEQLLTSGQGTWKLNGYFSSVSGDITSDCQQDDYLYFTINGIYIQDLGEMLCNQEESAYLDEGTWSLLSNEKIHMSRIDSQGNHVEEEAMLRIDAPTLMVKGLDGIKIYSKVE